MAATGAETIPETLLMTEEEDNNNGGDGAGAAVAVVVEKPGATDEQLQEVTRAAVDAASTAASAMVEGWKVELQTRFSGILTRLDEATTARKLLEQQLKAITEESLKYTYSAYRSLLGGIAWLSQTMPATLNVKLSTQQ